MIAVTALFIVAMIAQDPASIRAAMEKPLRQQQESVWKQIHPPAAAAIQLTPCDPIPPEQIDQFVTAAALTHGVNSSLIMEVARAESGFNPCSVSPKGAQGIMQLMPATQRALGVTSPYNPRENISAGTRLLGQLLQRYQGDIALTLGAYNAGTGAVQRGRGLPRNAETRGYVSLILSRIEGLRKHPNPPLSPYR